MVESLTKEELEILLTAVHLLAQQQGANAVMNNSFVSVSKKIANEITLRSEAEKKASESEKK